MGAPAKCTLQTRTCLYCDSSRCGSVYPDEGRWVLSCVEMRDRPGLVCSKLHCDTPHPLRWPGPVLRDPPCHLGVALRLCSRRSEMKHSKWVNVGSNHLAQSGTRRDPDHTSSLKASLGLGPPRHDSPQHHHPSLYQHQAHQRHPLPPTDQPGVHPQPCCSCSRRYSEATRVMQRILSLPAAAPLQMKGACSGG